MKLFAKSVRAAVVLLALPWLLHAEPIAQLRHTGYVNDFAHVLDQDTVARLDDVCQQIDQKAHAQIAVVVVNSLDGSDIESYAADLFKKWGIGSTVTNRGVLIFLAVKDRKAVGYGLEPILPDGKVGGFGREAVPLLRQNNYSGGMLLMTSRVADVVAQDAGVTLTGTRPEIPRIRSDNNATLIRIIAGIVVVVAIAAMVTFLVHRQILNFRAKPDHIGFISLYRSCSVS